MPVSSTVDLCRAVRALAPTVSVCVDEPQKAYGGKKVRTVRKFKSRKTELFRKLNLGKLNVQIAQLKRKTRVLQHGDHNLLMEGVVEGKRIEGSRSFIIF